MAVAGHLPWWLFYEEQAGVLARPIDWQVLAETDPVIIVHVSPYHTMTMYCTTCTYLMFHVDLCVLTHLLINHPDMS